MAEEVKKPEELIAELQAKNKELEELIAKQKKSIDSATADASKHKKDAQEWAEKYKEKLSEAEKAELERKQREEALTNELNTLRGEKRLATYTSKLMSAGYDAETASTMAKALPEGVAEEFFTGQKAFLDAKTQELVAKKLDSQPNLPSGRTPTPEDKEKAELSEILKAAGVKE